MAEEFNLQSNLQVNKENGELTRKEKLAFWGLVVLAALVIYLGFRQMGNNLKTPFALFALKYSGGAEEEKTEVQQLEELKQKDTDKDGLKDYDELYVFNTSPYLPDSDSDGVGDKEEVDGGQDPNCPKGQDCYFTEINNPVSGQITTTTLEDPTAAIPSSDQLILQNIFTENPDPKKIREFLLQSGGKKEMLDQFNDEELVKLFKEFMSSPTSPLNIGTGKELENITNLLGAGVTGNNAVVDINTIDLNALRKSLREKGVPDETLNQLDDKALLDLIKQLEF